VGGQRCRKVDRRRRGGRGRNKPAATRTILRSQSRNF
jgi:hypothetical protein